MKTIDYFITFLIIIKVLFIILALVLVYLKHHSQTKSDSEDSVDSSAADNNPNLSVTSKIEYWKDRCEFIYVFGVSILLLVFFFPRNNKPLVTTFETRFLLFAYAIIILLKLDWKIFFQESKTLHFVQKVV